jgi:hypothetical protein
MATRFLSLGLLIATDEEVADRLKRARRDRDAEAIVACRLELSARHCLATVVETMDAQRRLTARR